MSKIKLNIDGIEVEGQKGQTILDVAKQNSIDIPTLCYDKRIQPYGGCGLCVVEIEGSPKLFRACATEISENMVIYTKTEKIQSSRKTTLELLLTDHTGDCRPPCVLACPGQTDCQGYVGLIGNGEFKEALKLIKEQLPLPASIGRVCPHPCEEECRRELKDEPISIAWLKRFVADIDLDDPYIPPMQPSTGKKVAIVGGGPGGLSAGYYLLLKGHEVTIFDMMPEMGGMLKYGIPEYRLPKTIVDKEIAIIEQMGACFKNNMKLGKDITLQSLQTEYDAVYLSIGCWSSIDLGIPGEDLGRVYGGIHFLANVIQNKPVPIGKRVAVVGGGNTAMDACRTAKRLGAEEVYVLYRRTRDEMPAEEIEIVECEEEGIQFHFLVSPLEVHGKNGNVDSIRLQKMELGKPDSSGRRRPVPLEGQEETLSIDSLVIAIGQYVNVEGLEGIELTKRSTIASDQKTFSTSIQGVFAGGDAINDNQKIAIQAIGDGKIAADVIHTYLYGLETPYAKPYLVTRDDVSEDEFSHRPTEPRPPMELLEPDQRSDNFLEIVKGYSAQAAIQDAKRCLECGCPDYFECKLIQYSKDYRVQPEALFGDKHHREIQDSHPFISRNPDKCILCSLCVRICNEVMGVTALGLVDRGFDTIVHPDMSLPLEDTDCISCGQCISVCPTGALQEKLQITKPCPMETNTSKQICSYCSIGCNILMETRGNMAVRALPDPESKVDQGLLCVKGRFGYNILRDDKRLKNPLIRLHNELKETTWEEAFFYTAKKLESIRFRYGSDSIAVSVSDQWTLEDMYVAKQWSKSVLQTPMVTNFNSHIGGLSEVFGYDASPNTLDEITQTNCILLIGSNTFRDHTIAAIAIKQAVENGATLITINPCQSKMDEWATKNVNPTNSIHFLKEIAAALAAMGFEPKNVQNWDALQKDLQSIHPSEEAVQIAQVYGKSKKAMIVFDQNQVSKEGSKFISYLSLISGHIGKPRDGIVQLKPQNNSQSLPIVGFNQDYKRVLQGIQDDQIHALVVLGENPMKSIVMTKPSFLAVMDTHLTETAALADVVFPSSVAIETGGTFISTDRRIQTFSPGLPPVIPYASWEIIEHLATILKGSFHYTSPCSILQTIQEHVVGFQKGSLNSTECYRWTPQDSSILYTNQYGFDDGHAKMEVIPDGLLFIQTDSSVYASQRMTETLIENGLIRD
jgi:formate dehydrogenase major subunit